MNEFPDTVRRNFCEWDAVIEPSRHTRCGTFLINSPSLGSEIGMERPLDDSTEVLALQDGRVATPESSFAEILRRAFRHGKRSQVDFNLWEFAEVESELRAGWVLNGEMTEWHKVRGYVQMGFEHGKNEPREHRV